LMEWFPQGKVIHMMRDPRGIFVSELRRRREEATSAPYKQLKRFKSLFEIYILVQTTLAWLDSANRFQQYKAQYPHNYRLQRFEDLVRDPEEQIRSLCQFLGVEFQGEMLEQEVVSKGFQVGTVGFDSHAADRWKKHIAPWMHTWFRLVLGKTMKQFGYVA
ncbi:MAG: sulfotransferase, partial [Chloroflexota bacterium]